MTLERILAICTAYDRLGTAIQEQLSDVVQGRIDGCNPNAVRRIRSFMVNVKEHADVNGDDELQPDVETVLDIIDEWLGE